MPQIEVDDGCKINVEVEGPTDAPALMLSNSLGTNLHMWDQQMPEFTKKYRVIRYDRRGHGKSDVPGGPYTMERLGRDVVAILDALGVEKTNWCGLSMGGMVGQWLGANASGRVEKLVLSNTHSHYPDKSFWADRIKFIEKNGLDALVDANMQRWFTEGFRQRAPETMARMKEMFVATDIKGYIACCQAIMTMDFRASNPTIDAPTMVIVGAQDAATPPAAGEEIRNQIKGARLTSLEAAHISNMEQPQAYTRAVLDFLGA